MDFTRIFQHWEFNINTCIYTFSIFYESFLQFYLLFATLNAKKMQQKYLKCKHMQMLKENICGCLCRRAKLELKLKLDFTAK